MKKKSDIGEIILVTLFGIFVTIYSYEGFGLSNHIEHLPPILRNLDNSYLINDFFTNASVEGIARQNYALLISKLSGTEDKLPILFLILTILTNVSISLSTFFFTKHLFQNSSRRGIFASALVLSLFTFPLAGASSSLYTTYLNPSDIAFALILWAFYFLAKGNILFSVSLSGISSLIHPLLGLEMGVLFIFSYLVSLLIKDEVGFKAKWKKLLVSIIVFILFSLPTVISQFSQSNIESNLFIFIVAYFRHPHHYVPSTFTNHHYKLAIAFLITSGYIWVRELNKRDFFTSKLIAVLTVTILLLCFCGYFFVEIIPLRIVVTAQPFRLLRIVKWMGLILIAGFLTNENLKKHKKILYFASIFNPITLCISVLTQYFKDLLKKNELFLNKLLQPSLVLVFIISYIIIKNPSAYPHKSIILFFLFFSLIIVLNSFPKKVLQFLAPR